MYFRVTIHRPRRALRSSSRARSRLQARRGRRFKRTIRFGSSRRSLPPFFLFMARHRRRLQRTYPNLTMVQIARRLGRRWQRLPREDKEMYMKAAERLKRRRVRRGRPRSRSRTRMASRRTSMKDLMISFTTRAANLRDFLLSYL